MIYLDKKNLPAYKIRSSRILALEIEPKIWVRTSSGSNEIVMSGGDSRIESAMTVMGRLRNISVTFPVPN